MKRTVLWVVGAPGVGKTSFVRALCLGRFDALVLKPKWTLIGDDTCAAGHYTGAAFDGADTVPYNGAIACLAYWAANLRDTRSLTILDGDRFSHAGAREFFAAQDVRLACLFLYADDATLQARRSARGPLQNANWVKGRATKAFNFYTSMPAGSFGWQADARLDMHAMSRVVLEGLR